MKSGLLATLAICLAVHPAHADCEDGVASLTQRIAAVRDPHTHALLEVDLKRARIDMWEFDEVECAVNLEHAARLLKFGM